MDKFSSFEKYKLDPMYSSDKPLGSDDLKVDFQDWDRPYAGKGKLMSTAELAKTIELMDQLRNEVEGRIEDSETAVNLVSGFKKKWIPQLSKAQKW